MITLVLVRYAAFAMILTGLAVATASLDNLARTENLTGAAVALVFFGTLLWFCWSYTYPRPNKPGSEWERGRG